MKSSKSPLRIGLAFFFFMIALAVVGWRIVVVQSAVQIKKRSFESKIPAHVPLEVKIKKSKEDKVKDAGNRNWVRDFELEVTNTSDKPIYYLSLNIEMPDLKLESGVLASFHIAFGRVEFLDNLDARPRADDVSIGPKSSHTFVIEQDNMLGYEKWRSLGNKEDALRIAVSMNFIAYGDGTGYTSLGGVPFPVKQEPEEIARCEQRAGPPPADRWVEQPTGLSRLLANNFSTSIPAFEPVIFSAETNSYVRY